MVLCSGGSTSSPQGKGGGGGRGGGDEGGGELGGEGCGEGGGKGGGDLTNGGGGQTSLLKQKPAELRDSWAVQACSSTLVDDSAGLPEPQTRNTCAFHLPAGPGQGEPLSYTCCVTVDAPELYSPISLGFTPPSNSWTWSL